MEYYYIKLGLSNSLLPYWLQLEGKKNPFGIPYVSIYFYNISIDEYRKVHSKESFEQLKKKYNLPKKAMYYDQSYMLQIKPFIEKGKNIERRFITIDKGILYILEPTNEAEDLPGNMTEQYHKDLDEMREELQKKYHWEKEELKRYDGIKDSITKVRKVNIVKQVRENVPHILLTLSTNRYYNSGTFRRINSMKNIGVYRALGKIMDDEDLSINKIGFDYILELLSPHQFETLVFLIFINAGIYSPAWRAGSLPDIDLIGKNYSSDSPIEIGSEPVIFPPKKEVKFQLKRKRNVRHYKNADYTIAISSYRDDRKVLTSDWLYSVIQDQEKTIEWLEHSLNWFVEGTKYKSIMDII